MPARPGSKTRKPAAGVAAAATRVAPVGRKRRGVKARPSRGPSSSDAKRFQETFAPLVKEMVLEAIEDWMDVRDSEAAMKEPGERIGHEELSKRLGW